MSHCHVWLPESSEVALLVEVVFVVVLVVPVASLFRTAAPDLCYHLTAVPKLPTRQWPKISSHIYIGVYIMYIYIYNIYIYIYVIILYMHTLTMKWIYTVSHGIILYMSCLCVKARWSNISLSFGTSISTSRECPSSDQTSDLHQLSRDPAATSRATKLMGFSSRSTITS